MSRTTRELSYKDLLELDRACRLFKSENLPFKVSYAIGRTLAFLKHHVKEYQDTLENLKTAAAKKDNEGKPIIEGNNYVFNDIEAYKKEVEALFDEVVSVEVFTFKAELLDELKGLDAEVLSFLIDKVIVE